MEVLKADVYQSSTMSLVINIKFGLLAYLAIASAAPPHLSHEKTVINPSDVAGNSKSNLEYPLQPRIVDLSLATRTRRYISTDDDLEKITRIFSLDNTKFNVTALLKFTDNKHEKAPIFSQVDLTVDGENVPFNMNGDWEFISDGYYLRNLFRNPVTRTYDVLAKMVDNNLTFKIRPSFADSGRVTGYDVEIIPTEDYNVQVKVDGQFINELDGDVILPFGDRTWSLKISKEGDDILVLMRHIQFFEAYSLSEWLES